ncbi:hypothetical protein SASPL_119720 [Salvia splendens]|uniref:non-specific serine/threonine protein kinase n=1 Tax=Salvia splendens TaxID=180675 RepID=A0A8X8ZUI8_SALSN|nr:hypothetical protein SASPL_119720 [Salvia splendens]
MYLQQHTWEQKLAEQRQLHLQGRHQEIHTAAQLGAVGPGSGPASAQSELGHILRGGDDAPSAPINGVEQRAQQEHVLVQLTLTTRAHSRSGHNKSTFAQANLLGQGGFGLKIALGSAKGFSYLHEDCHPRIIHRDVKAADILLDDNFEAKVADFGLAKLSSDNNTHVSTRIMGTCGYLAPEYASTGKLTEKSDVNSFRIVLLELITGRRPIDNTRDEEEDDNIARPILMNVVGEGASYEELVDPKLENGYEHGAMLSMVTAAAACVRQSARKRPKMSQVVRALEGVVSLDDLHEVILKGSLSASSSDYDLQRHLRPGPGVSNQSFTSSDVSDRSQSSPHEQRWPSPMFHYGS